MSQYQELTISEPVQQFGQKDPEVVLGELTGTDGRRGCAQHPIEGPLHRPGPIRPGCREDRLQLGLPQSAITPRRTSFWRLGVGVVIVGFRWGSGRFWKVTTRPRPVAGVEGIVVLATPFQKDSNYLGRRHPKGFPRWGNGYTSQGRCPWTHRIRKG